MASPGDFKGQRRGACGHIMAAFDLHERCARCREKKLGEDPCVKDKPCSLCDQFSDTQKETLSTPSYRIRKESRIASVPQRGDSYFSGGRLVVC